MPALMSPEVMASRRDCAINSGVAGAATEVAAFAINAKVASLRLLTIIYHIWFEFKSYIIMGQWPEKTLETQGGRQTDEVSSACPRRRRSDCASDAEASFVRCLRHADQRPRRL